MSKLKIALCLHGLVGGIKGKNSELLTGANEVLELSHKHNLDHIISQHDTDVFIHSWSTELKDDIIDLYKPKSYVIEPQIEFNIPPYIKAKHNRAFAHLSRWYSFEKVVSIMKEYEDLHSKYDIVIVQRFDLAWLVTPNLTNIPNSSLVVGNCLLNPNREWSDRTFMSTSDTMVKFATLNSNIPNYMGPGGTLPSSRQWSGISSHFLTKHHADKIGIKYQFLFNYKTDYNEVRNIYGN